MNKIKNQLGSKLELVDKGPIEYFLGMEVKRTGVTGPIKISQKQLIESLLNGLKICKPCSTPLDPGMVLKNCIDCSNCNLVNETNYQSLIGLLMYIGLITRPDIIHCVNKLAQFNKCPHQEHLNAAKHILRYLNKTSEFGLHYKETGKMLYGFADSDWAGSCDDRKSYTGYIFSLAGAAVSYESKKQTTVALSTAEAEYMAISAATKEIQYLRNLLTDIGLTKYVKIPTILYGDNIGAQQLVRNPVYHSRSKHIDIRVHHVREVYQQGILDLKYVPSTENVADILTKIMQKGKHQYLLQKLGIS